MKHTDTYQEQQNKLRVAKEAVLYKRRAAFLVAKLLPALRALPGVTSAEMDGHQKPKRDTWMGHEMNVRFTINKVKGSRDVSLQFKAPYHRVWERKESIDRAIISGGYSSLIVTRQFPEPKAGFDAVKIATAIFSQHTAFEQSRLASEAREKKRDSVETSIAFIKKQLNLRGTCGLHESRGAIRFELTQLDADQAHAFVELAQKLNLLKNEHTSGDW